MSNDRSNGHPAAGAAGEDPMFVGDDEQWELRLYTAGHTPKSVLAFNNLKRICEEYMPGRYQIEVIDLMLPALTRVVFACFGAKALATYEVALRAVARP